MSAFNGAVVVEQVPTLVGMLSVAQGLHIIVKRCGEQCGPDSLTPTGGFVRDETSHLSTSHLTVCAMPIVPTGISRLLQLDHWIRQGPTTFRARKGNPNRWPKLGYNLRILTREGTHRGTGRATRMMSRW